MTVISALVPAATPVQGDSASLLHRSPFFAGVSRSCHALGRVLLEADFEPLVFFVGVFFLWVDKHLHVSATLPLVVRGLVARELA